MPVCIVKHHYLCATCEPKVLVNRPEPGQGTVELNDLCKSCVRGLKTSYVGMPKQRAGRPKERAEEAETP